MSDIPSDLRYAQSHEWARDNGNGTITVGISDHAQGELGDLVYVELPEIGRNVNVSDACAVVESVKAASDVYSPVAGEVVAVNDALVDTPELINQDPYGEGWLFKIASGDSIDHLLDASSYQDAIA